MFSFLQNEYNKTINNSEKRTYFLEQNRAFFSGIIETATSTFLLLILIKVFSGSSTEKSILSSAPHSGLILAPLTIYLAKRFALKSSSAISVLFIVGGTSLLLAALFPFKYCLILGGIISSISINAAIPLFTSIFQHNYPTQKRGTLFSKTNSIRVATIAIFGMAAGQLLSGRLDYFPLLLCIYSAAFLMSAFLVGKIPSSSLSSEEEHKLLHGFQFIFSDRIFRHTLICWMLMGLGNLMMIPLRVDYLANSKYGVNLSESQIALFVSVIPAVSRLVMSPVWGRLFDRVNFFWLRMTLNFGFLLGMLTFFASDTFTGFTIGAIIFGISTAGGDIAWHLWVTKFAPPESVADYMGVHTFMTGVRGIIAPFLGFYLAESFSLQTISFFGASLILVSIFMLLPEALKEQNYR